jgi:tetratricopeptide (TPR) repeat protein/DNA-binding SARP family transcriptional activator
MVLEDGDGSERVRFALLGPFVVLGGDGPVRIEGATAQALLVALLLRPEGYAGAGALISAVWGQQAATTGDNLYHHVTRLRRVLEPLDLHIRPGHAPAMRYRLDVPAASVDARRFTHLLTSAAALESAEPEEARDRLRSALRLWRGTAAFPELPLAGVRALGSALDTARLDAEERLAALEVRLGEPESRLEALRSLVAEHPGHAGVLGALITVLHATGLHGEAERVYRLAARRYGQRLPAKVEQAFRQQPDDRPGHRPGGQPAGWQVPAQITAAPRYFTGREAELAWLTGTHDDSPNNAGPSDGRPDGTRSDRAGAGDVWPARRTAAVVLVVAGMPGVGKSALALRAAHRMVDAGRFPDGALFVDLRGYSGTSPVEPAAALEALLRGLGVAGSALPPGTDARAALYRTVVARRRVLILLDNARDEAQVRPLLPGTADSLVLITSRRRLAGLDDADQINLEILPLDQAVWLFRAMVVPRAAGDDQTVEEIVRLCGRLPLAVRIAGARLKSTRALTGQHLLAQLRTEQGRLPVLDDGERRVASALAVSYRHLPAEQRGAFAALGLHPGPEFEPFAAAALMGITPARAQRLLDALELVNLIDQPVSGRYAFHDLVREYAVSTDAGTPARRHEALGRLHRFYARTASLAMDLAYPYEADARPAPPPASAGPELPDAAAARTWLDTEMGNLLAAAHHAADHGWPQRTAHMSATLRRHLRNHGLYNDAQALHQRALDIAVRAGDTAGELQARTALGYIDRLQGRPVQASAGLRRAIDLARAVGDVPAEIDALNGLGEVHYFEAAHAPAAASFARALRLARAAGSRSGELNAQAGLGMVHFLQGRYGATEECYRRAHALARATGDQTGELKALIGLAYVDQMLGRSDPAAAGFRQVVDLARATGNRTGELNGLAGLANVHLSRGDYGPAARYYQDILGVARGIGDGRGELNSLTGLGHIHRLQGHHGQAARYYQEVLDLARAAGERNAQFEAHLGLGRTHQAAGAAAQALPAFAVALDLARGLAQLPDVVRALDGLAAVHCRLGNHARAGQLWREALSVLADLDTDNVEDVTTAQIHASLADLDQMTSPPQA